MFNEADSKKKVSEIFANAFKGIKEPIALYGTGINTVEILDTVKDNNIVAILDAKKEGQYFKGLPIISTSEAIKKVKKVVIIARAEVVPLIYNRIADMESNGIEIVDVQNNKISSSNSTKYKENSYWKKNLEELKREIECHDVITFDIFDTLVLRKIINPEEIFDVVEEGLKGTKYQSEFSKMRKNAASVAYKKEIYPTYNEIYRYMKDIYDLSDEYIDFVSQEEIKTELLFLSCREPIHTMLSYAKSLNKKVYLLSDMYYCKKEITLIMDNLSISEYDDIFVSCDIKKRKWPEGDIYVWLKNHIGNEYKYLHIGDSEGADIKMANKNGIDAFYIMSWYEMMVHSSLSSILVNVRTLYDSIVVGMIGNKLLNDPFALAPGCGDIKLQEIQDYGYLGFGPIVNGMINWMITEARKYTKPHIWFLARDGYIFNKIYKIYEEENINKLPKAHYVLSSRRSVIVSANRNIDDINYCLRLVPNDMSNTEMLKKRFGINVNSDNSINKEKREEVIKKYEKQIYSIANSERERYLSYLSNYYNDDETIIVFDAVTSGTIAYSLEKILDRNVKLLCLADRVITEYSVIDELDVLSYVGHDFNFINQYNISKKIGVLESIFTSMEPTFICIDEEGQFVFGTNEKSQDNCDNLNKVHNGIIDFSKEFIKLTHNCNGINITGKLTDDCFGFFNKVDVINNLKEVNNFGVTNTF